MVWLPSPWSSSSHRTSTEQRSLVICHFCSTKLDLITTTTTATHSSKSQTRKRKGRSYAIARGTVRDWECGNCGCQNSFDRNGIIISDFPAHHDSQLNIDSFAKRGTPTKSTMASSSSSSPSSSSSTPFCRDCLSNQSLQIHLLASYDSEEFSPTSSSNLATYQTSLQQRYPLVCIRCLPTVESILKDRDYRTKTLLLGNRLRESQSAPKSISRTKVSSESLGWSMVLIWRIRGLIWYFTWVGCIAGNIMLLKNPGLYHEKSYPGYLIWISLVSLGWNNWDPTWLVLQRSKTSRYRNNGKLIVKNRISCLSIQMISYLHRLLLTSILHHQTTFLKPHLPQILLISLGVQLIGFFLSFNTIRAVQRDQVRIRPSKPVSPPLMGGHYDDPLGPIEALSISSSNLSNHLYNHPNAPNSKGMSLNQGLSNGNTGIGYNTLGLSSNPNLIKRNRINPEPKFGQAWILSPPPPPSDCSMMKVDENGDIEMNNFFSDSISISDEVGGISNGVRGGRGEGKGNGNGTGESTGIEFRKSVVRWGWNEPSSGLDEVFQHSMRVDDTVFDSDAGLGQRENGDRKRKGGGGVGKWFSWLGG